MKTFLVFICCLFTANGVYSAEKKAQLQYQPNLPVHLTSLLTLDFSQSLPGLSFTTKGKQTLEADLTLSHGKERVSVIQPPFNLSVLLKGLRMDVQANDEKFSFDSSVRTGSAYVNQLAELINRPIELSIGDEFLITHENPLLKKTIQSLPILQEIPIEGFLEELLFPLFAVAGKELLVGQVIERNFNGWGLASLPQKMVYTITEIDDYHVFATVEGEIKKHLFELQGKVETDEEEASSVKASLSGVVKGNVKWNRDNALLHSLVLEYSYVARFQLAEWEWLMHITLKLDNQTKLKG